MASFLRLYALPTGILVLEILAIVVPFTTKDIGSPLHLRVDVGEGGLSETSWALPQHVRSISPTRFTKRLGTIRPQTHAELVRRINTLVRAD